MENLIIFSTPLYIELNEEMDVLLISAIANTDYLVDYLDQQVPAVSDPGIRRPSLFHQIRCRGSSKQKFDQLESEKAIITTEKDAMRLELHRQFLLETGIPVFAIPVEVQFHFEKENSLTRTFAIFTQL